MSRTLSEMLVSALEFIASTLCIRSMSAGSRGKSRARLPFPAGGGFAGTDSGRENDLLFVVQQAGECRCTLQAGEVGLFRHFLDCGCAFVESRDQELDGTVAQAGARADSRFEIGRCSMLGLWRRIVYLGPEVLVKNVRVEGHSSPVCFVALFITVLHQQIGAQVLVQGR